MSAGKAFPGVGGRYYFWKQEVCIPSFGGRIYPVSRSCHRKDIWRELVESMRSVDPIPRRLWRAMFVCLPCAVVCAGMLMSARPSRAQDVAEAARKAKEQKAKEQKAAAGHVYTN